MARVRLPDNAILLPFCDLDIQFFGGLDPIRRVCKEEQVNVASSQAAARHFLSLVRSKVRLLAKYSRNYQQVVRKPVL
jgi:flagellar biosynthesis/type III secretory pathway chaperone